MGGRSFVVHPWLKEKLCGSLRPLRLCVKSVCPSRLSPNDESALAYSLTGAALISYALRHKNEDDHRTLPVPSWRHTSLCASEAASLPPI